MSSWMGATSAASATGDASLKVAHLLKNCFRCACEEGLKLLSGPADVAVLDGCLHLHGHRSVRWAVGSGLSGVVLTCILLL